MAVSSLFDALAGLGVVFKSGDEDSAKSDSDFFMKIDDHNLYAFADSVTYFFLSFVNVMLARQFYKVT